MSSRRIAFLALVWLCPVVAGAQDVNEEFFAAARKGDAAAVKLFLDKGGDVNAKTRYGATALSFACDKGHIEVVRLLIERGADVNVKDTFYGEVPIGWALSRDHVEIVKLLLDKGAAGVERVLHEGGLKPETLNNALRRASAGNNDKNKEIIELLKKAEAVSVEVTVEPEILKTYVGLYKNDQVGELTVDVKAGKLVGKVGNQNWFSTAALSKNSFAIIEVEATITFNTEGDKVTGFTLKQSGLTFPFKRVEK